MTYPTVDLVLPTALAGQPNGRLPDSLLTSIDNSGGRLCGVAARAWTAMARVASVGGIDLSAISANDAYRPYDVQEKIFRERYTTVPISTKNKKTWLGQTWYLKPGESTAAVPGTSNHGLGLAIDVANASGARLQWLLDHALHFGFSWEIQTEAWHLHYFLGDATPAVLVPSSFPKDDDMNAEQFARSIGAIYDAAAEARGDASILIELLEDDLVTLHPYPMAAAVSYIHREAKLKRLG